MIGLFRSHNVGTDCIAYSSAFRKITLNPNTWNLILPFEPGFNVLCALLNSIYLLRLCCCGVLCLRFIHLIWDVFQEIYFKYQYCFTVVLSFGDIYVFF